MNMTHMVSPSKFSSQVRKYCVESRDPTTGNLTTDLNLPFMEATDRQLCDLYINRTRDGVPMSQEAIAAWYNDRGWYFRPKTW